MKTRGAGHRWLTPVIPATQEAEIRRILVHSQPHANSSVQTVFCILRNQILSRCQRLMPVILATQEAEIRRISVQSQAGYWWHGSSDRVPA
jgi:hypothetical protein